MAHCHGFFDIVECFETRRTGSMLVGRNEHLRVRGWSFAAHPQRVFNRCVFLIDEKHEFPIRYGLPRRDVASAYHQAVLLSGFDVNLPVAALEPGEHELTFVGFIGDEQQTFGPTIRFSVLSAPNLVQRSQTAADFPGRVRNVSEMLRGVRHDGRPECSIRHGSSLVISGWVAASPEGAIADTVAVVLTGHDRVYCIPARQRYEPEAALVFGPIAKNYGFFALVDANDLQPGLYQISLEVGTGGGFQLVTTAEWVEIMNRDGSWLPNALPIYRDPFDGGLLEVLPVRVTRTDHLLILGWAGSPAAVSNVYARIDGDFTFMLTSGITAGSSLPTASPGNGFGGILAVPFASGEHELEILALDAAHAMTWSVYRHTFEVVAEPLRDASAAASTPMSITSATANK